MRIHTLAIDFISIGGYTHWFRGKGLQKFVLQSILSVVDSLVWWIPYKYEYHISKHISIYNNKGCHLVQNKYLFYFSVFVVFPNNIYK